MSCPTCDHTMHSLGSGDYWCPRCGTLQQYRQTRVNTEAPKLVERCRAAQRSALEEAAKIVESNRYSDNMPREHVYRALAASIRKLAEEIQ